MGPFFPDAPRTWVPVLAVRIQSAKRKTMFRTSIPLRLSWALTVHKCQGITSEEGTVFNMEVSKKRNPIRTAGLAFVGFTRTRGFDKFAVQALPPLRDFYEMRKTADFKNRVEFEAVARCNHERFLLETTGMSLEDEYQAHAEREKNKRLDGDAAMSDDELEILRQQLLKSGVADPDPAIVKHLQQEGIVLRGATLAEVASSFRGSRKKFSTNASVATPVTRQAAKQVAGGNNRLKWSLQMHNGIMVQPFCLRPDLQLTWRHKLWKHAQMIFLWL